MKKQSWLRGIARVLCVALLLPCFTALAAGVAPELTLLCPAETGGAAAPEQKFIWRSSVPVAKADAQIFVRESGNDGAAVYAISAKSDSVAISGGETGPWLITLTLSSLLDDGSAAFASVAGTTYTVTVGAGAFVNASDNTPCAETSAAFTLSEAVANHLVTYSLPDAGWKVESVDSAGTRASVPCGATVADGTILAVTGTAPSGKEAVYAVTMGGGAMENPNVGALSVSGDTHIVVSLRDAVLTGSATLKKADGQTPSPYTPAYGDTLKGAYSGDIATEPQHLIYTFYRGDTQLSSGASDTYAIQAADIGSAIRLVITSSRYAGSVETTSAAVTKQTVAKPAAPVVASKTATSVTLQRVNGCEYSANGGESFQSDPTFSGLTAGQGYVFTQRYAETDTAFASALSDGVNVGTAAELTGTVVVSDAPRVGITITASLSGSNNTGTLSYAWKRGNTLLSTGASYTPATADIGSPLTVEATSTIETGVRTTVTAAVAKASVGAPGVPTLAAANNSSITLNSVTGCEYSIDNRTWQDSPAFTNLASGQTYTFYQRYKGTDMLDASAASFASFATTAVSNSLTGTLEIAGDVRYGKTLVANLVGSNNTGTLSYTWYRGATAVGTGAAYDVNHGDIGYPLYVQVVSTSHGGSITKLAGTVQKAEFIGISPAAPTRESRSTSRITLTLHTGYEYSRDGKTWQSSNVFSGLSSGKTYKFYQRIAATADMDASPASDALSTSTSASSSGSSSSGSSSSSSSGSSSSSSSGSSGTDSSSDNAPSGTGSLYSYATTTETTRILFSTMERLVNGNKTQDVTITSGDVQFRFFKGTMQLSSGTLWYDFGVELNGAELMAAAKAIAGDSVVATVRFNHSGELPAKANIRIALDSAQAGKALYYYRLENGTLTYIQTAIADISGAVTVVQSSCSDYVLLDRDFYAAAETPSPSPEPSTAPTAVIPEETGNKNSGGGGWFIALVIIAALLLIVAGILFYLKSRRANTLDDDFGEFDDDPDDDPNDNDPGFLGDSYEDGYDDYAEDPLDEPYRQPYPDDSASTYTASYTPPSAFARPQTPYETPEPAAPAYEAPRQTSAAYTHAPAQPPASAAYPSAAAPEPPTEAPAAPTQSAPQTHPHENNGQYPRARYRP